MLVQSNRTPNNANDSSLRVGIHNAINLFAIGGTFLLQWWMGLIVGLFPTDAAGAYPPAAYTAALLFTGIGTTLTLLWYLPMLRVKKTESL